MTTLKAQAAVAAALREPRPQDAINGVKNIVARELQDLDPYAEVHSTEFFNHSFAPDFVLTWRDGRAESRDVYLRPTVLAGVQGQELRTLDEMKEADQIAPVVLALESTHEPRILAFAAEAVATSPRVLLTALETIDDIVGHNTSPTGSPIGTLVKANLVRGGKGLILDEQVEALVEVDLAEANPRDPETFAEMVRQNFNEEAATRIERTAQLITMARTGDLSALHSELGESPEAVGGRLSRSEMQLVLPYLLGTEGVTGDARFWSHLGNMVSLAELESMATQLENLDLTRLVLPNLNTWLAARASLSLYTPELEHETDIRETSPAEHASPQTPDPRGRWQIQGKMFSAVVGAYRLHVTASGKKLNFDRDAQHARWPDLQTVLGKYQLAGVTLHGIDRKLELTSTTAKADVDAISSSVEDDYSVSNLSLRSDEPESQAQVNISFRRGLAIADGPIHMGEIARMTLDVLGYRHPVDQDAVAAVIRF